MSKERLEEIKNNKTYLEGTNELIIAINTDDYDWLTEQAERVQELEQDVREWEIVNKQWEKINTNLVEQNKRYLESREVIEQVYKDNYVKNAYGYEDGFLDGLDIAIDIIGRALESEE